MEENWYNLIEDYNQGRLTKPLQAQFEAAMAADAALYMAVQQNRMQWDMQELLAEAALRTKIRQQFLEQQAVGNPQSWFVRNRKWTLVVLLLGGIGFFIFINNVRTAQQVQPPQQVQPKSSEPVAQTPAPDAVAPPSNPNPPEQQPRDLRRIALASYRIPDGVSGIRGPADNDALTLANQAFVAKKYRSVVALLTTLPEEDVQEALLLRAHAQFNVGNYAAAAADFTELDKAGIYRRDGEWFGVLSHLAMPGADKNAVKSKLNAIRGQVNHPYQKEANALWGQVFDK